MFKIISLVLFIFVSEAYATEIKVKLTAYCSCEKCCSWHTTSAGVPVFNSTGKPKVVGVTACGVQAREGLTLAMPKGFAFGTHVYLKDGTLLGVCEDRGGAIKEKDGYVCIDVYMDTHKKALQHGVQWTTVVVR